MILAPSSLPARVAILLLLGLVACGGKKAAGRDASSPARTPGTVTAQDSSPAPVPDAGAVAIDAAPEDAPPAAAASGGPPSWHWENPRVPVAHLRGVWGSSASDVYAVGERGTILHTRDGGRTWAVEQSGTTVDLFAIWGSSPDDVFVVGYGGTILHSVDGGTTWTPQKSGYRGNLVATWGSGRDDVYVVGGQGSVLRSTNSGKTWKPLKVPGRGRELFAIWGSAKDDVYLLGADPYNDDCKRGGHACMGYNLRGAVLYSDDVGKTWAAESRPLVPHAIWGISDNERYLVSSDEGQHRSTLQHVVDDTETLDEVPLNEHMSAIWASGKDDVFAVGESGTIMHSADSRTWQPQSSGVGHHLRAVWGSGKGDVFVVGDYGTILHSADSGAIWSVQGSVTAADLHAVWGAGSDVLAVGDDGVIVRRSAGTWAVETSGTKEDLTAIWGSGKDDVYIVGDKGSILRRTGGRWKAQPSGAQRLAAVWGSGKNDVYATGEDGAILHSTDAGKTWTPQRSGTKARLTAIWGSGKDDVHVAGGDGTLLHSTDSGQTWTLRSDVVEPAPRSVDKLVAIWGSSKDHLVIVGDRRILHSTDAGKTWKLTPVDEDAGRPTAVWGSGPDDAYVLVNPRRGGVVDGSILHSTDGGTLWGCARRPDCGGRWGVALRAIWGTGNGEIFVVGVAGTILRYGS